MSSVQISKHLQRHSQCLSSFCQTLETLDVKVSYNMCFNTVLYTIQFLAAVMHWPQVSEIQVWAWIGYLWKKKRTSH